MYDFEYGIPEANLWVLVMQTRDVMTQLTERLLAKAGLTPEKWNLLHLCMNSPQSLTVAELSRMLFRKPHTVSGLLNRMEEDGLVKRGKQVGQEAQPMHIKITPKGRELYYEGTRIQLGPLNRVTERLPKEQLEQLENGLRALRNSLLQEINIQPLRVRLRLPDDQKHGTPEA